MRDVEVPGVDHQLGRRRIEALDREIDVAAQSLCREINVEVDREVVYSQSLRLGMGVGIRRCCGRGGAGRGDEQRDSAEAEACAHPAQGAPAPMPVSAVATASPPSQFEPAGNSFSTSLASARNCCSVRPGWDTGTATPE